MLILAVGVLFTACHSGSTAVVNEDSILTKYSIDTLSKVADSTSLDSLKVK